MRNSTLLPIVVALLTAAGTPHASAQMDVDQADSLNFEAFHKDKKEAVKVWKDDATKKAETVKTYEQTAPAAPAANQTTTLNSAPVAASTTTASKAAQIATATPGQRFEIRERYALGRSASTPYSAFYVIEAMHQQSAKFCPKGWKKLTERSEPVDGDFYLYYEIECL
jgi:hypothetical protein